jgi:hypothetical protein
MHGKQIGNTIKNILGTCGGIKPLNPKSSRSFFPSHCNKEKKLKLTFSHSDGLICAYSQKIKIITLLCFCFLPTIFQEVVIVFFFPKGTVGDCGVIMNNDYYDCL